MKKLFIVLFLLITSAQKSVGQENHDLYYLISVPAFDLSYQEKDKLFLSNIFVCTGDEINNRQHHEAFIKEFKTYLLRNYSIWNKYSDPYTQANWNVEVSINRSGLERRINEMSNYTKQNSGDVFKTGFTISDCLYGSSKNKTNTNTSQNTPANQNYTINNQTTVSANPFTNLLNENYDAAATTFLSMYLNRNKYRDVYTKSDNWESNKGYWYKGSWKGNAFIGPWITAEDSEYKNVVIIENYEDTPDNEYHLKKQSTTYIMAGNFPYTIAQHPRFEVFDKEDLLDKIVVCKKGVWDFEMFYYFTPNKGAYLTNNAFKNRQIKYYYSYNPRIIKEYSENGNLIYHSEPYSKTESRYKENGDIIYEFDMKKGIAHSYYDNGQLKYKIDYNLGLNGIEVEIFKPNGDISHTENVGVNKQGLVFHRTTDKIIRYNDNGTVSFKRKFTTISKKKEKYNDEFFNKNGSLEGTNEKIIKTKQLNKGIVEFVK